MIPKFKGLLRIRPTTTLLIAVLGFENLQVCLARPKLGSTHFLLWNPLRNSFRGPKQEWNRQWHRGQYRWAGITFCPFQLGYTHLSAIPNLDTPTLDALLRSLVRVPLENNFRNVVQPKCTFTCHYPLHDPFVEQDAAVSGTACNCGSSRLGTSNPCLRTSSTLCHRCPQNSSMQFYLPWLLNVRFSSASCYVERHLNEVNKNAAPTHRRSCR